MKNPLRDARAAPSHMLHSHWAVIVMGVRDLSPAYFALVMATGIISIAADLLGMLLIAIALLWLNVIAYVILWTLTILRMIWFTRHFVSDMLDHQRSLGFLTAAAGTCILGVQFIRIAGNYTIAMALGLVGLVLWVCLTYAIFTFLTVKEDKPSLADGITGAWLIAVVATQSIAVLSALLAAHWEQPYRLEANFLALSMWLWGGMLYIWMISLIFLSLYFFQIFARRPVAAVLDQHGRDGDFGSGGRAAHYQ